MHLSRNERQAKLLALLEIEGFEFSEELLEAVAHDSVGFFVRDRRSAINPQTSFVFPWEISPAAVGNLVRDLDIPWEIATTTNSDSTTTTSPVEKSHS